MPDTMFKLTKFEEVAKLTILHFELGNRKVKFHSTAAWSAAADPKTSKKTRKHVG